MLKMVDKMKAEINMMEKMLVVYEGRAELRVTGSIAPNWAKFLRDAAPKENLHQTCQLYLFFYNTGGNSIARKSKKN